MAKNKFNKGDRVEIVSGFKAGSFGTVTRVFAHGGIWVKFDHLKARYAFSASQLKLAA